MVVTLRLLSLTIFAVALLQLISLLVLSLLANMRFPSSPTVTLFYSVKIRLDPMALTLIPRLPVLVDAALSSLTQILNSHSLWRMLWWLVLFACPLHRNWNPYLSAGLHLTTPGIPVNFLMLLPMLFIPPELWGSHLSTLFRIWNTILHQWKSLQLWIGLQVCATSNTPRPLCQLSPMTSTSLTSVGDQRRLSRRPLTIPPSLLQLSMKHPWGGTSSQGSLLLTDPG